MPAPASICFGEESRLRAVLDTAVDGMILIDAHGTVLMFNPACERLFGYSAEEVLGANVKVLMPSPYREEHDRYLENFRHTGTKRIIGIGREVTGRRKDGSIFPMELSVGEAAQPEGSIFVGIIRDLSERKRAEQLITETAARLRAVVDTAVDGVILIDAGGSILMFNPACEKLFGYSVSEALGQNVRLLMPAPYRDEHDGYLTNYHESGERKIIGIGRTVTGQRKDGSTFPMALSVGEARQDGKPIFVGVIHDLTEHKRTSEQLVQAQKMEAVGQLSGGIAHDFNNLLTVVIGNAELLIDDLEGKPALRRTAEAIVQAAERGAELTQRLLAFGRRQTLRPTQFDCNALVASMQRMLRRMLMESIEIRTTLDKDLCAAFADSGQLENALLNLAINARDAMPRGGSLIFTTSNALLDARYRERFPDVNPGHYVMVGVTDTGHGMTADILERVFEPFFTTKEIGKGSGLGLSMVYGFAKQSNGHVSIYSEPGLGTTVRIYLPAAEMTLDQSAPMTSPRDDATEGRELVLLAEDDPFVRSFAVQCLTTLGYRVVEAINGRQALERLSEIRTADILFTDVVMPGGMNGWELAEKARRICPDLKVLLTSGYALETLAEHGRLPTGAMVINKPYWKAELAQQLRKVLGAPLPGT